jgi:hypothetical protein
MLHIEFAEVYCSKQLILSLGRFIIIMSAYDS